MSRSRSAVLAAVLVALTSLAGPVPAGAEPAKQEWRVTTIAGIGESGYSGDGGPATEARLGASPAYDPQLAIAADGTMYLAEWENHRLRRITPDGVIGTVPGTTTRLGSVRSVAIAGDGTVYAGNDLDIRRLGPNGTTEVVLSEDDGLLNDIAVDKAGVLYYETSFYDDDGRRKQSIVRLDPSGATRTVAEVSADIQAVEVDAAGTVYYTTGDMRPDSNLVHAVGADGATRTVVTLPKGHLAGSVRIGPDGTPHVVDVSQGQVFRFDGRGTLTPVGPTLTGGIGDFAFSKDGTLHVVVGATVRRVERFTGDEKAPEVSRWDGEPGTVHRVVGSGNETRTAATGLSTPAVAEDGTVYVAEPRRNVVHAISRDGKVTRFAGTGAYPEQDYSPAGKTADKVALAAPHAVAVADDGTVYIETRTAILSVTRDRKVGVLTEIDLLTWQTTRPDLMPQLTVDGNGTVFYPAYAGPIEGVIRSVTDGGETEDIAGKADGGLLPGKYSEGKPAKDGTLQSPTSVSVGADGTIYFVETSSEGAIHAVRAVRPDGVLVTVAGNADTRLGGHGDFAGDGGPATKAKLNNPRGVAAGPDGSFYIADT
jgi:sugar lactone lactonase YvrE